MKCRETKVFPHLALNLACLLAEEDGQGLTFSNQVSLKSREIRYHGLRNAC